MSQGLHVKYLPKLKYRFIFQRVTRSVRSIGNINFGENRLNSLVAGVVHRQTDGETLLSISFSVSRTHKIGILSAPRVRRIFFLMQQLDLSTFSLSGPGKEIFLQKIRRFTQHYINSPILRTVAILLYVRIRKSKNIYLYCNVPPPPIGKPL